MKFEATTILLNPERARTFLMSVARDYATQEKAPTLGAAGYTNEATLVLPPFEEFLRMFYREVPPSLQESPPDLHALGVTAYRTLIGRLAQDQDVLAVLRYARAEAQRFLTSTEQAGVEAGILQECVSESSPLSAVIENADRLGIAPESVLILILESPTVGLTGIFGSDTGEPLWWSDHHEDQSALAFVFLPEPLKTLLAPVWPADRPIHTDISE